MADESRNVLVVTFDDSSEFAKMFMCVCVYVGMCGYWPLDASTVI